MVDPVDPTRCPLCGAPNHCALADPPGATTGPESCSDCWCARPTFDATPLQRVPKAAVGKACICPTCAGANKKDAADET